MLPFLIFVVLGVLFAMNYATCVALMTGFIYAMTHLTWVTWLKDHWLLATGYAALYLVIGAVWSLVKWWLDEHERVEQVKRTYVASGIDPQKLSLAEYMRGKKTNVAHNREGIIFSIVCWVISMPWTILDNPVRRIARHIYAELQGVYQRITDSVWK